MFDFDSSKNCILRNQCLPSDLHPNRFFALRFCRGHFTYIFPVTGDCTKQMNTWLQFFTDSAVHICGDYFFSQTTTVVNMPEIRRNTANKETMVLQLFLIKCWRLSIANIPPQGWWDIDAMYLTSTLIIDDYLLLMGWQPRCRHYWSNLLKNTQDPKFLLLWHFTWKEKRGICQKKGIMHVCTIANLSSKICWLRCILVSFPSIIGLKVIYMD